MGANNSNCKCIYLPAQSGKTKKVEDLITEYKQFTKFEEFADCDIFISANNRVLVAQTATRMKDDLGTKDEKNDECIINGSIFCWMSGTKKSKISSSEIENQILKDKMEMIMVCAHKARLDNYLKKLLDGLEESNTLNLKKVKINIWIDEADKSINLWSKYENKIFDYKIVNKVTLITATLNSILKRYKTVNILPFEEPYPDCYRGLKDMNKIEINYASGSVEYVKHIINTNRNKLTKPGMRAFIPGEMKKKSHDEIADFLSENGFIVIVINGERKEILVPDGNKIDLKCYLTIDDDQIPKELNYELSRLYKENNWKRYPLAITGYYCVSRGVTFQCRPDCEKNIHDGFLFDYAIIPPISSKAEAYQTMARVLGNIGDIEGYKPVDIYSTTKLFHNVEELEYTAMTIAAKAKEENRECFSIEEIKEIGKEIHKDNIRVKENNKKNKKYDQDDKDHKLFDTQEDAIVFGRVLGYGLRRHSTNKAPQTLLQNGNNPSVDYLLSRRFYGINEEARVRMCPTDMNKWCVYWRPSIIESHNK